MEMRINKEIICLRELKDDQDDKVFWLEKTPQYRINAIEQLRRINYGTDVATARLQRFFEVTEYSRR